MKKIIVIFLMLLSSMSVYSQYNTGSGDGYASNSGTVNLLAPNAPTLTTPANNAINQTTIPILVWNNVLGASSYRVQISTSPSFETFIVNELSEVNNFGTNGLDYSTVYYWRVQAIGGELTSAWSSVWSFNTIVSSVPSSWAVISNTGNSSMIGFTSPESYSINGRTFAAGDAIGLFYTRDAVQYCAGYLVWGEAQFGMSVWGDNDETTLKDGYDVNETYTYRLWDNVLQAEVLNPTVIVQSGDAFYSVNGLTVP